MIPAHKSIPHNRFRPCAKSASSLAMQPFKPPPRLTVCDRIILALCVLLIWIAVLGELLTR